MKTLYTSFVVFTIAFLIIQFHTFLQFNLPDWVLFYVKDFLCMPIVLTIGLVVAQVIKKDRSIRLSLFTIMSLTVFYTLYFEIFLPRVHTRYTADLLDVLMYFSGSLLFYFLQGKSKRSAAETA